MFSLLFNEVILTRQYVLGDASTTYGGKRAANGRKEPWEVSIVEIGNEDNLGGGCESYPERFMAYYEAISKVYPDLTFIASTDNSSCLPKDLPEGVWLDWHTYDTPEGLVSDFDKFDNQDRKVPYFIGEYSRQEGDWPDMKGSVSEAVFMIGLERNSDVVKMAAYAPLLQLVNSTQWTVSSFHQRLRSSVG